MLKAVLDLNCIRFMNYQHLDLEKDWRSINVICLWLRVRAFNLALPVFVTRDTKQSTMTFFQTIPMPGKTIVLVHPNPAVLRQLDGYLKNAGHIIHKFSKVKDANAFIADMTKSKTKIHKIVVPKNLEVSYNFTYCQFLNHMYPGYDIITVDEKNYRDNINLRTLKKEYINELR